MELDILFTADIKCCKFLYSYSLFLCIHKRENLSITCTMDMEDTLGPMALFMKEISMRTSKEVLSINTK